MAILSPPDRTSVQLFCQFLYQFSYYYSYCYNSKLYRTDIPTLQGGNEGLRLLIPQKHTIHAMTILGGEELWMFMGHQVVFSKLGARDDDNNNKKPPQSKQERKKKIFLGLSLITARFFWPYKPLPAPDECKTSCEHCGFLPLLPYFCS